MSAQQFIDRRDSLTTLVSNNLFQNRAALGSTKKGNYMVVNYMKAAKSRIGSLLRKRSGSRWPRR